MSNCKSEYIDNLINPILRASVATEWVDAVREWDIVDCEEDESKETECMCGHEGIRYCFRIRNRKNGSMFYPIGSECIKKFENKDLSQEVAVYEKLFRLYDAIRKNERIEISATYFSRKLLRYLFEKDVYTEGDYNFLVDMFNTRDKDSISSGRQRKINGIIAYQIKPYLRLKLRAKGQ